MKNSVNQLINKYSFYSYVYMGVVFLNLAFVKNDFIQLVVSIVSYSVLFLIVIKKLKKLNECNQK
jgi:hypothetical protein